MKVKLDQSGAIAVVQVRKNGSLEQGAGSADRQIWDIFRRSAFRDLVMTAYGGKGGW